ncbi:nuclear pore complex protein Nup155 [Sporothrix schenckii 1099-18]|uniref:Nuclear pore complex protein Nup155 n=1 Tax=Sporothrix schenckii 1099-18 TaxID=1397361 RepID=A0A0F2LZR1_SPOSC|nr:nuclear pore complex protein Nup155 [Sporothrix schenckii 1099-18]KJR81980.1 nuclear pore complex protein Nup155 [Sporothrix schenckii 1099-18]
MAMLSTPRRQIPGSYFATPGPAASSRLDGGRSLFDPAPAALSASSGVGSATTSSAQLQRLQQQQQQQLQQQQQQLSQRPGGSAQQADSVMALPAPAVLTPIQKAAGSVNRVLQLEESYPDLDSYCRPGASSEYDIHGAESAWAPFHKVQTYPIPDQIFERYNVSQLVTSMGLFPEINHAYACIDSSLFLWDYTQPNPELIGFEDQPHAITAIGLVPPKPGVFVKNISHVLVVATEVDIILLGVEATPTPTGSKQISLYQTKMSIHRGGGNVSFIVGTAAGRIFLGGRSDTDVHEIFYQQEEKWFSNRVGKTNHSHPGWSSVVPAFPAGLDFWTQKNNESLVQMVADNSRNLLYTLSNKSTIRTYHIESPDRLTKVIEKHKNDCLRDITHMINTSPLLTDRMSIVGISPIAMQEASKLHLVAVTSTGCRLFLSATSSASYTMNSSNTAPQSMQVQFVKFPPKEAGAAAPVALSAANGFARSAASDPAMVDLQSRSLDPTTKGVRFAPGFCFDFVVRNQELRLFLSAPETGKIKVTTPASALKYYEHGNWISLGRAKDALDVGLVTQPFAAAQQPLGFGNELAVQFDAPPSEFAILTNDGVHVVRRRRLVDIFATAVRTLGSDDLFDKEIRKFIHLYGRVETVATALAVACGQGSDLRAGTSRATDQTTEDRAKTAFVNYGGQPTVAETDSSAITIDSVRLSSRHDALALYLTRLVRTLWAARVVTVNHSAAGVVVGSTVPTSKLTAVQENLERLRTFLKANAGSIQGLSGPTDVRRRATRHEEIALQAEHQALHALQKLMESISEGISFVLMLFDERVADIYVRLDDGTRDQLRQLTYESLFARPAGKDLAKLLVKAIVNRNIESGSNVETVADALRRRCGSFCSPDDVVIFKAQEQLQRASEQIKSPQAARGLLSESLHLFERVAGSLTYANLTGAVAQYVQLKYYAGAIQLCLMVAHEKDRGNAALAWLNDGKPDADPRRAPWQERKRCYDLVHTVLRQLDTDSSAEPEQIDGRPTLAFTKRTEAYNVVNDAADEVFHFDLYEWYIEENLTDRLLAIDSPHVVTFLQRLAATDVQHADLLCRFYTHRSRFFDAAQVQFNLAGSAFAIGIKDRITLLSRAKANASVSSAGVSGQRQQQLNHEVTELLDIAHIQDDLLERLLADGRIPDERKVEIAADLDGAVLGLSELFNGYADQAGYYDLCLLIYNAADYHNPRVIADTWKQLINSTHEEIEARLAAYEEAVRTKTNAAQNAAVAALGPPPLPYEAVSVQIQTIAHRTSLDALIFPVETLLGTLCEYALTRQQDASIGADPAWPVLLFLQLRVSHAMVVHVLERLLDAQEVPFTGRRRRVVVAWIDTAVALWCHDVEVTGQVGAGDALGSGAGTSSGSGSQLGPWVADLMARAERAMTDLLASVRDARAKEELEQTLHETRQLRARVDSNVRPARSTMRFR